MGRTRNQSEENVAPAKMIPGSRRRLSKEARHEALITVGLQLFGARPYSDVTIKDICVAANVSPPLLQHYFGNKRAFFLAVMAHAVDLLEQTARPGPEDHSFRTLTKLMHVYFAFIRQHPAGAALSMRHGSGMDEELQGLFDPFRAGTVYLVTEALGESRVDDVVTLAIRNWVGLNELIALQLLDRPSFTTAAAARYSSLALFSLIRCALMSTGRTMPADWEHLEQAVMGARDDVQSA
jgi:AcrR family transcriptional regulator